MRMITVYYSNGQHDTTSITGTDNEILAYYMGREFNLGDGAGGDLIARAVFVDFIDNPIEQRHKSALKLCLKMMNDNDHSGDKMDHPWIPGTDCKLLKKLVMSLL